MTNREKIKQMNDDDLSFILMCPYDTTGEEIMPCATDETLPSQKKCCDCIKEWLGKEAKEGVGMERLSMDEVIAHCKRHTDRAEGIHSKELLETGSMEPFFMKEYWEHRQVAEWLAELKEYRNLGTPAQLREVDKLYLEKCEEVNALKAQLAAVQKCVEQIEKLETHTEVIISDVLPLAANEVELISRQSVLAAVKGVVG